MRYLLLICLLVPPLAACAGSAAPVRSDTVGTLSAQSRATPHATPSPARPTPPAPLASARPPADFAFIFDSNPCGIGRLDTSRGAFTQGRLWRDRRPVPLELSPDELAGIYGTMREIDIFSYPRTYAVPLPPDGGHILTAPAPRYLLEVRADGRATQVRWDDEITGPNPPEARELRALMTLIEGTVAARPEVRMHREAMGGCD